VLDSPPENLSGDIVRVGLESLGRLSGQLCGPQDALTFLERVVLDAFPGNPDAHPKNWAVISPDARGPRRSATLSR
jgi:serine/threonine-protein kinase HipA